MTEVYTDKKTDETKVVPEGEVSLNSKFDKQPVFYNCQNCGNTGYTIVEQSTTALAYLFMIIMIFTFGLFFSLLLLPFIFFLTRTFTHKCSTCLQEVGSDNKLLGGMFNLQDKIVSINIGELGIVLTRKIILGFFLVVLLFIVLYLSVVGHHHHHHHRIVPIDTKWDDFLKECGRENLHNVGEKQRISCEIKYYERTVQNWRGYVIRIDDFRESLMKYMHHAVGVLIKMDPSESEYFPDIILAIDSEIAAEYSELLNSLNRGSEIIFNATMMSIGSDSKTRHAHIVNMQRGTGTKDIPMHVHEQGRYGDRPRFFKGAATASTQPLPISKDQMPKDEPKRNP